MDDRKITLTYEEAEQVEKALEMYSRLIPGAIYRISDAVGNMAIPALRIIREAMIPTVPLRKDLFK